MYTLVVPAKNLYCKRFLYEINGNKLHYYLFTGYTPRTKVLPTRLQALLHGYHKPTVNYLINGFTFGFRIGCVKVPDYRKPPPNHQPVLKNIEAARELVAKEVRLGRVLGPFKEEPFQGLLCSPLNLVPKANSPGRFRLIHNLAYPYCSQSVNANIPDSQATVAYAPFDKAVRICLDLGVGCRIGKLDFDSAFRIFPISGLDLPLLGFRLDELYYVNSSMAFGCRSSCRIFEVFSTAIDWLIRNKANTEAVTHYLDDFLLGHRNHRGCSRLMNLFTALTNFIGAPLSPEKTEGPTTCLVFLGLRIDTLEQTVSIPKEKLAEALVLINSVIETKTKSITIRKVQQIAGKLQFVTKGIPAGRPFLRRVYNLLSVKNPTKYQKPNPNHHIKLSKGAVLDLKMWKKFIEAEGHSRDRVVPFLQMVGSNRGVELFTDASGSSLLGAGFIFESFWGFCRWPVGFFREKTPSIALLELAAVVLAVDTYKESMASRQILVRSDNESVVHMLSKLTSKCKWCMALIRHLTLVCLQFQIRIVSLHIEGKINFGADALSRLEINRFNRLRQLHYRSNGWILNRVPTIVRSPLWPISWSKIKYIDL